MKSEQYIKTKLKEWTNEDQMEFKTAYAEGDWDVVYSMTEDLTGSTYSKQQILAELAYSPLSFEDLTELEEIVNREQELSERLRVTQNSLRVLLAWCDRMLIDDKHLIGSICKQADDSSFRHAISTAEKILKEEK